VANREDYWWSTQLTGKIFGVPLFSFPRQHGWRGQAGHGAGYGRGERKVRGKVGFRVRERTCWKRMSDAIDMDNYHPW
jgi:hypothetical protein